MTCPGRSGDTRHAERPGAIAFNAAHGPVFCCIRACHPDPSAMATRTHELTEPVPAAPTARAVARDPVASPGRRALVLEAMARGSFLGGWLFTVALAGCSDGDTGSWPKLAAIPLTTPNGVFWGPMLSVGNQSFLMDLDTGSTTTAVAGAGCTT